MTKKVKVNTVPIEFAERVKSGHNAISAENAASLEYDYKRQAVPAGVTVEQVEAAEKAAAEVFSEIERNKLGTKDENGNLVAAATIGLTAQEADDVAINLVYKIDEINENIRKARDGYMSLLPDLGKLRQSMPEKGKVTILGETYQGFKGFCMGRFGFSKSTYYNLMSILDTFYNPYTGEIPKEVMEMGLRPALALIQRNRFIAEKRAEIGETRTENGETGAETGTENGETGAETGAETGETEDFGGIGESREYQFDDIESFEIWLNTVMYRDDKGTYRIDREIAPSANIVLTFYDHD